MLKSVRYSGLLLMMVFLSSLTAFATHNRAGEILFERIGSNPFLYKIIVITYTKTDGQSAQADRCELDVLFGDGTQETVTRKNGPVNPDCQSGARSGVVIAGTNTRYNIYSTTHEYPGPGTYKVSMEDPMRIGGIVNIPGSDNVPFYIESYITIDVGSGGNNAPVLQNPPIDNGCVQTPFYHNPGAVDAEGDSLAYSLVDCRTFNGTLISNYLDPDEIQPGQDNQLDIDPRTGTVSWISPQQQGIYNIAILIEEYRTNDNSGEVYKVGSILRDMQINIGPPCLQEPPFIDVAEQACVVAGEELILAATASDPDGNRIEFSAVGYPLDFGNGGILSPSDTLSGIPPLDLVLNWQTQCDQARAEPYWLYWKAKEDLNEAAELAFFKTTEIRVIDPGVLITSVEPEGTSITVRWTEPICEKGETYLIYRNTDSTGYEASECVTGVPAGLGYELIGEVDVGDPTVYVDDNDGSGLNHGVKYCYMIVLAFSDNSESYPSPEGCAELIGDVPIINKVSVNTTELDNGNDSIAWFHPTEFNEAKWPPPYKYVLSRSTEFTADFEEIFRSGSANSFDELDTIYVDNELNTEEEQYYYKIELLSGTTEDLVGGTRAAASMFLTSEPGDNKLRLSWDVDVPWRNTEYHIYKMYNHPDSGGKYRAIDTVSEPFYIDQGLANLREYKYKIEAVGSYSSEDLPYELINWSQIHTGIPIDNEPPCTPPNKIVDGDCDLESTFLSWDNPNEVCPETDDVLSYRIYFSPRLGQAPSILVELDDARTTEFTHYSDGSIAGCYAIVAVDSFGNESDYGEALCVDNCPLYELPNIFTPGQDGINDYFVPIPDQFRFVESIDLTIFNRWGVEVFNTKDPEIRWDGTDIKGGDPLPSGVYFYSCTVNEIYLTGIRSRQINSYVHLMREGESGPLAD